MSELPSCDSATDCHSERPRLATAVNVDEFGTRKGSFWYLPDDVRAVMSSSDVWSCCASARRYLGISMFLRAVWREEREAPRLRQR